jgi:hypothetical protein
MNSISLTTPSPLFEQNYQSINSQDNRYYIKIDNISLLFLNYTDFTKDEFWSKQLSSLGINFTSNLMKKIILVNVGTPNFNLYIYETFMNLITLTLLYGQGNAPSISSIVKFLDKEIRTLSSNYELLNELNFKLFLYDNCINVSNFEFINPSQNFNILGSSIPPSLYIWKKSIQYTPSLELSKNNNDTLTSILSTLIKQKSEHIIPTAVSNTVNNIVPTTTPAFGQTPSSTTTPAFGQTSSSTTTPAFGQTPSSSTTPAFGQTSSSSTTPAFGQTPSSSTTPAFGQTPSSSTTPAFGQTPSSTTTPAFGQQTANSTTTPAFGQFSNFNFPTPVFGQNTNNTSSFSNFSPYSGTFSTFQPQKK